MSSSRVLLTNGEIRPAVIEIDGGLIQSVRTVNDCQAAAGPPLTDCLLLPGIVDLHGDAFERQLMPRAGVRFPYPIALRDTDSQLIANGITTAFYGVTASWEPGLRGEDAAEEFVQAFQAMRPFLRADSRLHLRFEIYALEAIARVCRWMEAGWVDLLAFNDHTDFIAGRTISKPFAMVRYSERSGLPAEDYRTLLSRVQSRFAEVPAAVNQLAAVARAKNVRMASHDDDSPAMRQRYHALGCRLCEFPVDQETAREADRAGDCIVLGAPNVVRGGSHVGRLDAVEAIREGICHVLTSDYYYPSQLHSAFQLASGSVLPLAQAWALVAKNPADAVGLHDRGSIAPGLRADLIWVDDSRLDIPRVAAVMVAGKTVA